MTARSVSVDICIPTYKRPDLLEKLLCSLEQQVGENRIVIVDNDPVGSARDVVERFARRTGISTRYEIQPLQNISLTRNAAISLADADYLAFIDDDETASESWLHELLSAAQRFDADVVFGPTLTIYPQTAPEWLLALRPFDVARKPTGSPVLHGASGNLIMRRSALLSCGQSLFDPDFGTTGGEDLEFFRRINIAGLKMIWCDEAVTFEPLPESRANLAWLLKRTYRGGQSVARIIIRQKPLGSWLTWLVTRIAVLGCGVLLPLIWVLSREHGLRLLIKMTGALGQITGHTRFLFREYKA